MKTYFLPKLLTIQLLNNLFLWEIVETKRRIPDAWGIDFKEVKAWKVRHKIFRGCAVILNFEPRQEDISYYAENWLKKTKWIKL